MNLVKKEAHIVRLKSMTDGSYRIEIDLGELSGETLGEIENLRKEGIISMVLTSSAALREVIDNKKKE